MTLCSMLIAFYYVASPRGLGGRGGGNIENVPLYAWLSRHDLPPGVGVRCTAALAVGESVIQRPSPLNGRKCTYDHSRC
jgi:hypothetical protein